MMASMSRSFHGTSGDAPVAADAPLPAAAAADASSTASVSGRMP